MPTKLFIQHAVPVVSEDVSHRVVHLFIQLTVQVISEVVSHVLFTYLSSLRCKRSVKM